MKTVFSNSEVPHIFASRTQDEGRNSGGNIFFNKEAIFSYGYHFPMASFSEDGQTVYLTTRGYSNSTAKHLNYTRQALNHFSTIYCSDPLEAKRGIHRNNLNNFNSIAKESAHKLRRANKPEIYLSQIESQRESFQTYCEHFKIKMTKKLMKSLPYLFIESKNEGQQATDKEVKAIEKAKKDRIKSEVKKHATELKEFRTFERQRMYSRNGFDYLRHNTETKEIETSQGITIDLKEAERVYKLVLRAVSNGGCSDCGDVDKRYKINSITSESLIVGCHTITIDEILEIGGKLFL